MRKNLILVFLATLFVLGAAAAVASVISVTLEASQPVSEQAVALMEYVNQLPQEDQDEWREEFKLLASDTILNFAQLPPGSEDSTVYIADSGNRYHLHIGCRGLNSAETISKVLKEVAIGMGRTACKICYPNGDGK